MAGVFVEHCVDLFEFDPIARRRQIYFQDAGVRNDTERSQPRIGIRCVTLDPNRHFEILARIFDCGDKVQIVRKNGRIGQKDMQSAFLCLHTERWPDQHLRLFGRTQDCRKRIGLRFYFEEFHAESRR